MKTYGHFINGEEVVSSNTFEDINPYSGEVYALAPRGDANDAKRVISAARTGFEKWSSLPPPERERIMLKAADLLETNLDRLTDIIIDESGSVITKARGEVLYSASLIRAAAGEARRREAGGCGLSVGFALGIEGANSCTSVCETPQYRGNRS